MPDATHQISVIVLPGAKALAADTVVWDAENKRHNTTATVQIPPVAGSEFILHLAPGEALALRPGEETVDQTGLLGVWITPDEFDTLTSLRKGEARCVAIGSGGAGGPTLGKRLPSSADD